VAESATACPTNLKTKDVIICCLIKAIAHFGAVIHRHGGRVEGLLMEENNRNSKNLLRSHKQQKSDMKSPRNLRLCSEKPRPN
jgi:hypothetical protein